MDEPYSVASPESAGWECLLLDASAVSTVQDTRTGRMNFRMWKTTVRNAGVLPAAMVAQFFMCPLNLVLRQLASEAAPLRRRFSQESER